MPVTVSQKSSQTITTAEYTDMGSVGSLAAFSRSLIRREQSRSGGDAETAIRNVASRLKMGQGTLANIVRNRVKSVGFHIGSMIIAAAIADIESERKQLEHERDCLMALGPHADASDLAEVEESLAVARQGIARMRGAR